MRDDMRIREERETDLEAIHNINELAFGRKVEAELVDKLRDAEALLLSLVAVRDYDEAGKHRHETMGHIGFSPATLDPESTNFKAVCLAPVAVLPAYQNQGIGSMLIKEGLKKCLQLGHTLVFLCGRPEYYPRFGFVRAKSKGFECEFPAPDEAWMMIELRERAAAGKRGTVKFHPVFREMV